MHHPSESAFAAVFPGQGCQRDGMARDFDQRFRSSRLVFDEAAEACGLDLRRLCFDGDPRLALTEYSQPALVATGVAMLRGLHEGWGFEASRFGGHSLGEYTALVAAGALALADAVRIVRERGRLMQRAVPPGLGTMIAMVGESLDRALVTREIERLPLDLANDNSEQQLVLAGPAATLRDAAARIVAASGGGCRSVELEVSAPFHSRAMHAIEREFDAVLAESEPRWNAAAATRVTSNRSGGFHDGDAASLRRRLVEQLSGTVRWRDNMRALVAAGQAVVEIGPARPLRGLFRTIGVDVLSIVDLRSAERALQASRQAPALQAAAGAQPGRAAA